MSPVVTSTRSAKTRNAGIRRRSMMSSAGFPSRFGGQRTLAYISCAYVRLRLHGPVWRWPRDRWVVRSVVSDGSGLGSCRAFAARELFRAVATSGRSSLWALRGRHRLDPGRIGPPFPIRPGSSLCQRRWHDLGPWPPACYSNSYEDQTVHDRTVITNTSDSPAFLRSIEEQPNWYIRTGTTLPG